MAPIYSQQLYNANPPAGAATVVYTVPGGHVVVVTDIDRALQTTVATDLSYISLGAALVLVHTSAGAELFSDQWRGRQVLNAGQTITAVNGHPSQTLAITGYVLQLF
jgi:hypothetical protein